MEKSVIYQVFTRVCCNSGGQNVTGGDISTNGSCKLNSFTPTVLDNIKAMGVTHIWFTGLIAHASCTSYRKFRIPESNPKTVKGCAGSPYAIRDYYDIDPDLAVSVPDRMTEFQALVDRVHAAGMKFIMDFVPNHVARQYHSVKKPRGVKDLGQDDDVSMHFSPQNNFYYMPGQALGGEVDWGSYKEFPARATGNDQFTATPSYSDWYETVKLNYGVDYTGGGRHCFDPIPDTWKKMLHILLYWASKGVDAFRCDMAEMVPVDFWHWAVRQVKESHPEREAAHLLAVGIYRAYIIAVAGDHVCQTASADESDFPLLLTFGCICEHPAVGIHYQHDVVLLLGNILPYEHLLASGGSLPVDVLDIVAGNILSQLIEIHAAAFVYRVIRTVQDPACGLLGGDGLISFEAVFYPGNILESHGVLMAPTIASMIDSSLIPSATAAKFSMILWRRTS